MDDKARKAMESAFAKGDNLEIKKCSDGTIKVYQVSKRIIYSGPMHLCPKG